MTLEAKLSAPLDDLVKLQRKQNRQEQSRRPMPRWRGGGRTSRKFNNRSSAYNDTVKNKNNGINLRSGIPHKRGSFAKDRGGGMFIQRSRPQQLSFASQRFSVLKRGSQGNQRHVQHQRAPVTPLWKVQQNVKRASNVEDRLNKPLDDLAGRLQKRRGRIRLGSTAAAALRSALQQRTRVRKAAGKYLKFKRGGHIGPATAIDSRTSAGRIGKNMGIIRSTGINKSARYASVPTGTSIRKLHGNNSLKGVVGSRSNFKRVNLTLNRARMAVKPQFGILSNRRASNLRQKQIHQINSFCNTIGYPSSSNTVVRKNKNGDSSSGEGNDEWNINQDVASKIKIMAALDNIPTPYIQQRGTPVAVPRQMLQSLNNNDLIKASNNNIYSKQRNKKSVSTLSNRFSY